jgi:hypothetical protein
MFNSMKPLIMALTLILCILASTSCRKGSGSDKVISGPPEVGGFYSLNDGEGGYRVGKIVAVEDGEVVFINLFANRWMKRPALVEARKAATPAPVAYSSQSFAGMQPVHLEKGTATEEEIEAYESWKLGKRETF